MDLSGDWTVQLQEGDRDYWDPSVAGHAVTLPGSLTSNGIGNPITMDTPWSGLATQDWATLERYKPYRQPDNIKVPFWLQPDAYYTGPAWYRREVEIPEAWAGKHLVVHLERCHWKTTLYVDDREIGSNLSLSVPHRYDVTAALTPGRHVLTICVDNTYHVRIGTSSSSVTDHTQTNWNGLVGDLSIMASDPVWIERIDAYPDIDSATLKVVTTLGTVADLEINGTLAITARAQGAQGTHEPAPVVAAVNGTTFETELVLGENMLLWDEFDPALYTVSVELNAQAGDATYRDTRSIECGMRTIATRGRTLLVNGRPAMMRGTIDCATFPLTGYPSTDIGEWRRIFTVAKNYGLNHIRFHSWCPPKAAFVAADRLGLYLMPEGPVWRGWCEHQDALPVEPYLLEEGARILHEYGNHPSFAFFSSGNEPWELDRDWLADTWLPQMKALDCRRLMCAAAHFPILPNNDFQLVGRHDTFHFRYHQCFDTPPATTRHYEDQIATQPMPCISHEAGQWCVFPNLKEIDKYTGCLKPRNYEIVHDFLAANHLLDQAGDFLWASGRFQTAIYKECTEAFLRTRDCGGYQMLGLNDFPGQGTALVGAVDVFWEDKGYTSAEEYRRFNGPVVPLAIMEKRVWTTDETFRATLRIAQFSAAPMENVTVAWRLADGDATVAEGAFNNRTIPVGNNLELGVVAVDLQAVTRAAKLNLSVAIRDTDYANDWNIWVYPAVGERTGDGHSSEQQVTGYRSNGVTEDRGIPDSVTPSPRYPDTLQVTGQRFTAGLGNVVHTTNAKDALAALEQGRKVLLAPGSNGFNFDTGGTFAPIFWNKPWFPGQKEHTTGLLVQADHPIFADFPTDRHADWQWWEIVTQARPMVLDGLDPALHSPIQPIDDWNTCRRLGLLVEARVGAGALLLTSLDIGNNLDTRPVIRQLLKGMLEYMNSPAFAPSVEVTVEQLKDLVPENPMEGLMPTVSASSVRRGFPAENLLDLNPAVFWHSKMRETPGYPHEIVLTFDQPAWLDGFNVLPRQDGESKAMVKTVAIHACDDGQDWGEPLVTADLTNNQEWKQVRFPQPVCARMFKVVCLAPQEPDDMWASFAQLTPIRTPT